MSRISMPTCSFTRWTLWVISLHICLTGSVDRGGRTSHFLCPIQPESCHEAVSGGVWCCVILMVRRCADHNRTRDYIVVYWSFAVEHWKRIYTNNVLERLNIEALRSTNMVCVRTGEASVICLVRVILE